MKTSEEKIKYIKQAKNIQQLFENRFDLDIDDFFYKEFHDKLKEQTLLVKEALLSKIEHNELNLVTSMVIEECYLDGMKNALIIDQIIFDERKKQIENKLKWSNRMLMKAYI
jgi:hypothetical protein